MAPLWRERRTFSAFRSLIFKIQLWIQRAVYNFCISIMRRLSTPKCSVEELIFQETLHLSATMNILKVLTVLGYGKFVSYFGHCPLSLSLYRFSETGSVCVIINTVLLQLGSTERAGLL